MQIFYKNYSSSGRFCVVWMACGKREYISLIIFGAIYNNIDLYRIMCGILCFVYGGVYIKIHI
jgi:hypothetical protein